MAKKHRLAGVAVAVLPWLIAPPAIAADFVPPPPPVFENCDIGPFYFFFDSGSAIVGLEAQAALDSMMSYLGDCPNPQLTVAGSIDATEDARVSMTRARSIHSMLIERGVAPEEIALVDSGRSKPMVQSSKSEIQNRYVSVTVSRGPERSAM